METLKLHLFVFTQFRTGGRGEAAEPDRFPLFLELLRDTPTKEKARAVKRGLVAWAPVAPPRYSNIAAGGNDAAAW